VEGLDRKRYEPVFFYYPSGLPLDKLGTVLAQTIRSLDKNARSNGQKIVLAAHSMGGLVALSAINKLAEEGLPASLKMYCSLSTPYAGDENARKGIEIAPVVVPVWRDVAAQSDFLRELTSRPFPTDLPFYLFFSYHDTTKFKLGESSDGSVSLRSQLVPSLQTSAAKVLGFNETHVGILRSEASRQALLQLLDTITLGSARVMGE
jgi:pimeloyl-ACP methyl ester carboxylesterase